MASDSPRDAGEDRDQARQDGGCTHAEQHGEQDGVRGERTPRAGVGRREVAVRLLDAERGEVRRQDRHRGQERHVPTPLGAEGPGDDQDAHERQHGGPELRLRT